MVRYVMRGYGNRRQFPTAMLTDLVRQHQATQAATKKENGTLPLCSLAVLSTAADAARVAGVPLERRKGQAVAAAQRVSHALVRDLNTECAVSGGGRAARCNA